MAKQTVRWGLVSTARINERLIRPCRGAQRSELLAVASRNEQKARAYAREWDIPRAYGSYQQMLDDSDVDAVYISLPNGLHCEWCVKAADAGKHVLCEKPLALTIEQVDQIEQAAQRNGVIVQEAAMMRFHPQITYVQQLLADRAIGDVRLFRGIFTYVLTNQQDVRMLPDQGGGSLWDLGTYCVRFIRSVLQSEPVEVVACQNASESGIDLSFAGQMKFANGAHAQFFSSFESFAHVEGDLLGTEGRIQLDFPWVNQLDRDAHVRLFRHDGSPRKSPWDDGMLSQSVDTKTYEDVNAYQDQADWMVQSILDGTEPSIPLSDSRKNTVAVLALHESARERRAVRV